MLGKIIDKLSGASFIQFMTERQFQVAHLSQTGFGDSRDVVKGKAQSYGYDYASPTSVGKLRNAHERYPPFRLNAAGITSTAEDMARWIIALQQRQILKEKASLTTLWTPPAFNNGKLGQSALGWGVVINRPMHRAVGMTGGGRAAFYIYPDDDLAVVILTNLAGSWPEELIDQVATYYIPSMRLPGISALRVELQKRGFENAQVVEAELRKKDASFQLAELEMNDWAYRLLSSGKAKQAVEIFKLIVSLYPESGNAYDSLAFGYDLTGNRALAIKNYKRSLELDPKNTDAGKHLKRLERDSAKNSAKQGEPSAATSAGADDSSGIDDEGFVRQWLVLLPIPIGASESPIEVLNREQIKNEAGLKPKVGDKVKVGRKDLIWRKKTAASYLLDFNAILGRETEDSIAYAVSYIVAPKELKNVKMKTGSDDLCKVYLNGKEVFKYAEERGAGKDQDTTEVTLRQGINVLVAKVINVELGWGFCVRFTDQDDQPLTTLKARSRLGDQSDVPATGTMDKRLAPFDRFQVARGDDPATAMKHRGSGRFTRGHFLHLARGQ